MRCSKAHQDFQVYQLTLRCFVGFAMESLPVGNCGSRALDLGSKLLELVARTGSNWMEGGLIVISIGR